MDRFLKYLDLFKPLKLAFAGALLCGLIAGVSSGFGVPFITRHILPKLFKPEVEDSQVGAIDGFTLRLTSLEDSAADLPDEGKNLVLVARKDADDSLIFLAFDESGAIIVDQSESDYPSKSEEIETLKRQFESLWNAESDVVEERRQFLRQLASITGRSFVNADTDGRLTTSEILLAIWIIPVAFAIRGLGAFFNVYLISYCGIHILEKLRMRLFERLQMLPFAYFQTQNSGDLLSRVMNDTDQIKQTITRISNDLVVQPFTFLGALAVLIYLAVQNPDLGFLLIFLALIPLCVIPVRWLGKKLQRRAKQMQKEMGLVMEFARENLSATREVRMFNLQEKQIDGFQRVIRSFFKLQLKVVKYNKSLSPTLEFITVCGFTLALFFAARVDVTLSEVTAVLVALYFSYEPVKKLGEIHNQLRKGQASLERMEAVLDAPITIRDAPDARPLETVRGEIQYHHVSFAYEEAPALKDIDCRVGAGEICALVGASGAGKSTFISLLPRLYDASAGKITLDGEDIRNFRLHDLRAKIAVVPQDPMLFNDTIFENIRLSRPEASPEEVYAAAQHAFADGFIHEMEDRYDTRVGEKGARLSGGQKQRIALARAFLKNAPILILDEATSALDSESEARIQAALRRLVLGKTVIMIAHRFSTIQMADRIFVFDAGRIIAQGPHRELYGSCKEYKGLYDRQLG